MKNFAFKIDGQKYNVSVNDLGDNKAEVEVNGKKVNIELEKPEPVKVTVAKPVAKPAAAPVTPAAAPKATASAGATTSPLPGTIVKILLAAGTEVKAGDTVLTMESMKMENNIVAERGGKLNAIFVNEGQNVMQGDALFEIV